MTTVRILCAGALLWCGTAVAQAGQPRTEVEAVRSILAAERQGIVAANLSLSADEAKAFWPLYNAYREEMRLQGDRLVELLGRFLATARPTEADAAKFSEEYLDIASRRLEIRKRFVAELGAKVSPRAAARVLVLEEKVDAMVLDSLFEVVQILKQAPPA